MSFHGKTFNKLEIEGNCLNLVNVTYKKPTINIIFNVERLKAFPPKSEQRQGSLLSSLKFNIMLKVLATAIRQKEAHKMKMKI